MKNTPWLCRSALISVVLLISACIPGSRHPLPPPADGKGDDRLIGRWDSVEKDNKGYMEIVAAGGGRYYARISSLDVNGPDGGKLNETAPEFLTTPIGGQWFMSVIDVAAPDERDANEPGYLIFRYEITAQDELLIFTMSREAVVADVRAGLVAGEADPEGDILLTADSEALATYIAATDPKRLFLGELIPLRRH